MYIKKGITNAVILYSIYNRAPNGILEKVRKDK